MATKKTKKNNKVKVHDLKPRKDAKGGFPPGPPTCRFRVPAGRHGPPPKPADQKEKAALGSIPQCGLLCAR